MGKPTRWGVFLYQLSTVLSKVARFNAGVVPPPYERCSVALVEAFLFQGADPNTIIAFRYIVWKPNGGFHGLVRAESPIASISHLKSSSIGSKLGSELETRLRSAGGEYHEKLLYLEERADYRADKAYYLLQRFSDAQIERLGQIFCSAPSVDVARELEAHFTEDDKIDEDKVKRYMNAPNYSFSDVERFR